MTSAHLYHKVTTSCVYYLNGKDISLAKPKSVNLVSISKFWEFGIILRLTKIF